MSKHDITIDKHVKVKVTCEILHRLVFSCKHVIKLQSKVNQTTNNINLCSYQAKLYVVYVNVMMWKFEYESCHKILFACLSFLLIC